MMLTTSVSGHALPGCRPSCRCRQDLSTGRNPSGRTMAVLRLTRHFARSNGTLEGRGHQVPTSAHSPARVSTIVWPSMPASGVREEHRSLRRAPVPTPTPVPPRRAFQRFGQRRHRGAAWDHVIDNRDLTAAEIAVHGKGVAAGCAPVRAPVEILLRRCGARARDQPVIHRHAQSP